MAKSPSEKASKTVDAVDKTPVSSRRGEMEELKRQLAESVKQNAELSKQVAELIAMISRSEKERDEALEGAANYWKVATGAKASSIKPKAAPRVQVASPSKAAKSPSAAKSSAPVSNLFDVLPEEGENVTGRKERIPPLEVCARSTVRGLTKLLRTKFAPGTFTIKAPVLLRRKVTINCADTQVYNNSLKVLLEKKIDLTQTPR